MGRDCLLGDVLTLQRGYDLPSHARREGSIPIVSSSGVTGTHAEAKVAGPGVVTGRYGTLGEVHYVPRAFWPLNTTLYVRDFKGNDPRFVAYFLQTLNFANRSAAAAVPGINRNDLHRIPVHCPDLQQQRRIASILSAYDDLIENNTRRIAILEEMARRVYEEWFVRFRFPGHEGVRMVESELGLVPDGWRVTRFTDVFDVRYGKGLGTKDLLAEGQYPVYGAGGVIGRFDSFVAAGPTCLITSRGNGSGTVWRTVERAFVTNNSFLVYPKAHFTGLSFGFAEVFAGQANVKTVVSGSAQPQLTIDGLAGLPVIAPERGVLLRFDALVSPMFDLANRLHFVRRNLGATRDLLLPKLISGELDVSVLPEPEALAA